MKAFDVLLSLASSVVLGREVAPQIISTLNDERLAKLYKMSRKHDIAHLIAAALDKCGTLGDSENSRLLSVERDKAIYRYTLLARELDDLSRVLEEAEITYMPLKGSVIRALYPEPWMRTSCDVDVLVKREDLEAAKNVLQTKLGYTFKEVYTDHDISLFAPSGMHIELHYDLLDDDRRGEEVILRVWEDASPAEGSAYRYVMSPEMFYFYHVVHMANHFRNGGCGVRTLLDLYLLNHNAECDRGRLDSMLSSSGFSEFECAMRSLCEVWFGGAESDEFLSSVEQFILTGGVYGTQSNRIAVSQVKSGGRVRYLLSRIFISNKALKKKHPILEEHPYLIPWYHVKRWFKPLFNKKTKESSMNEIAKSTSAEQTEDMTAELLRKLNI